MYLASLDGFNGFTNRPQHSMVPVHAPCDLVARYTPYETVLIGGVYEIPDYFNDLNAIHRVARLLPETKQKELRACLWKMCGQMFVHLATAAQMAKAVLLIHGQIPDETQTNP